MECCSAAKYCPKHGATDEIENVMTQYVRWTPKGFMILGTACDGDCRTEITTHARKDHDDPTIGRLENATELAHKLRQMCETDAETCDCYAVQPGALASHAQLTAPTRHRHRCAGRSDEDAQDTFPRPAGGHDIMPANIRSPMASLSHSQYLTTAPSLARASAYEAMVTLGRVDAAKDAQRRLHSARRRTTGAPLRSVLATERRRKRDVTHSKRRPRIHLFGRR